MNKPNIKPQKLTYKPFIARNDFQPTSQTINRDSKPYLDPVSISSGTVETTLGGVTTFKDINGGTVLTYDPITGTITIAGGLIISQAINLGTISNTTITGQSDLIGTLTGGGQIGSVTFTKGTITNSAISGTITSSNFTGTITNSDIAGTATSITGTISDPIILGTPTLSVNAGSASLGTVNGKIELQTYGTGIILTASLGGTTFRFTPSGTI